MNYVVVDYSSCYSAILRLQEAFLGVNDGRLHYLFISFFYERINLKYNQYLVLQTDII